MTKEPSAEEPITVTIADDYTAQADDVAARLRVAGMNVEQVLDAVGVITGSVAGSRRRDIEALPGVATVEGQHMIRLAPPDAEVQ